MGQCKPSTSAWIANKLSLFNSNCPDESHNKDQLHCHQWIPNRFINSTSTPCEQRAPFENLIQPLFAKVCQWLDWHEVLPLVCISKQLYHLFHPSTCCCGNLWVDTREHAKSSCIEEKCGSRCRKALPPSNHLAFIQYMESATLNIDLNELCKLTNSTLNALAKHTGNAISSGSLRSLYMNEVNRSPYYHEYISVFNGIRGRLTEPTCRLTELYLVLSSFPSLHIDNSWSTSWLAWQQCTSLKYLHIDLKRWRGSDLDVDNLLGSLPNCLEDFGLVQADKSLVPCWNLWSKYLGSDTFLPLLKSFSFGMIEGYPLHQVAQALALTVMKQTGVIRPTIRWSGLLDWHIMRNVPLRELEYHNSIPNRDIEVLAQISPDVWSNLQRLSLSFAVNIATASVAPFVSSRPLVEFHLDMYDPLRQAGRLVEFPLHLPEVRLFSLSYRASTDSRKSTRKIISLLHTPKLEVLHIYCEYLSTEQIEHVLQSVPQCCEAILTSIPSATATSLLLAMVLHYCPSVSVVRLKQERLSQVEHVADVQAAHEKYPFDSAQLHNLKHVALSGTGVVFCPAAQRMIVQHLSAAPRLEVVKLFPLDNMLDVATLLELPHYRDASQILRSPALSNNHAAKKMLENSIDYMHAPASTWSPLDSVMMHRKPLALSYQTFNLAEHIVAARNDTSMSPWRYPFERPIVAEHRLPVFTLAVDGQGQTGKERFLTYLLDGRSMNSMARQCYRLDRSAACETDCKVYLGQTEYLQ